jgi:predicted MPP superfamily phosphohydrolase
LMEKLISTIEELAPLKELEVPVYFVEGNHDKYSGVNTIKKYLAELGVDVLENEVTHFGELQIIGLNHMSADNKTFNMHASSEGPTIENTLASLNIFENKPTVLLHHSPGGIKYANQHGVDLYLAGHTHAGQLFPIKYIANLIFDYNKGLHNFKDTQLFVSQGAGTFGPPMRVGTKSEITVLTLIPEKQ